MLPIGKNTIIFKNKKMHTLQGMKILPLSTQDLVKILESSANYNELLPKFQQLIDNDEM